MKKNEAFFKRNNLQNYVKLVFWKMHIKRMSMKISGRHFSEIIL